MPSKRSVYLLLSVWNDHSCATWANAKSCSDAEQHFVWLNERRTHHRGGHDERQKTLKGSTICRISREEDGRLNHSFSRNASHRADIRKPSSSRTPSLALQGRHEFQVAIRIPFLLKLTLKRNWRKDHKQRATQRVQFYQRCFRKSRVFESKTVALGSERVRCSPLRIKSVVC